MTNVANQNDDDIIELTDVVIVGTANKAARHTAQVAPDSMLTTQDDTNMSTDDILDSMLEEFPKKMNPSQDSLDNGLNVHGLDGLLKSMDLDNVNDADNMNPSLGDMLDEVNTLQNNQEGGQESLLKQQKIQNPQITPQNLLQNSELNPIVEDEQTFSPNKENTEDNVFNDELFASNNEPFDLMQVMGDDNSLNFSQDIKNLQDNELAQQGFAQESFQENTFDETMQNFDEFSQEANHSLGNFEETFNTETDFNSDTFNSHTSSDDNFGLDGDISDIVDPNSSFNPQNSQFENFDTDSDFLEAATREGDLSNTFDSSNLQDNDFASHIEEFPQVTDIVSDEFPQMSQNISDEFPQAPSLAPDDFSNFSEMETNDLEFTQSFDSQDQFSQDQFAQAQFSQDQFAQDSFDQNFQVQQNSVENVAPQKRMMDSFEEQQSESIHVKNDFSDLESIDPNTLTVEDINLEEALRAPTEMHSEINKNMPQDLENFDLLNVNEQDAFMADLDALDTDLQDLDSLNTSLPSMQVDISLESDFVASQEKNFKEQDLDITEIDRSAFKNDAELAHMLEMPEEFTQVTQPDISMHALTNQAFENQIDVDANRINSLEEKLDVFSTNTTDRLEMLQSSVDTLSSQVSSIEEHISVSSSVNPQISENSFINADTENTLMYKLENKVKILESRIEKLEEFFEAQSMHNSLEQNPMDINGTENRETAEDSTLHNFANESSNEVNIMREDMARVMARMEELEANMEKNVALTAARVLKEEIIPLLTGV